MFNTTIKRFLDWVGYVCVWALFWRPLRFAVRCRDGGRGAGGGGREDDKEQETLNHGWCHPPQSLWPAPLWSRRCDSPKKQRRLMTNQCCTDWAVIVFLKRQTQKKLLSLFWRRTKTQMNFECYRFKTNGVWTECKIMFTTLSPPLHFLPWILKLKWRK